MELPLILDRYRPLAELGRGGHGSVTLAFDTKMARRVAIKRLPLPAEQRSRTQTRAGLAEARTAALLNHPNIVTVHEWDADRDEAFIVMEAVDGVSLAELLDSAGAPLAPDEAAALAHDVGAALCFAHDNGVLHLDLKPANLLITRDGRVKVADFGVAALTDVSGRARGGSGTVGYMPPEQLRDEDLDERADEWALAAVLFEALTGANPFDADTIEGSLFKIEIADVPAPTDFEPTLGAGVDVVLLGALAPEPAERYPDVAAFAAALEPQLGDVVDGRASLAEAVDAVAIEGGASVPRETQLGLWDRLARHAGAARRTAAALACAWLVWAGLDAFTLGTAPTAVAAALGALASALAPALGLALGVLAFCAGIAERLGLQAALIVLIAAGAFWAARGRLGRGDAIAPLAAPLVAPLHASLAAPLVLGFAFEPLAAAVSAVAASAATMALSAATGAPAPFLELPWETLWRPWTTLADAPGTAALLAPGPLVALVGWGLAAAVCSLACRRATRAAAVIGVLAGGAVLGLAYALWGALAPGEITQSAFMPEITVGLMVAIGAIALGAPTRPEEA